MKQTLGQHEQASKDLSKKMDTMTAQTIKVQKLEAQKIMDSLSIDHNLIQELAVKQQNFDRLDL